MSESLHREPDEGPESQSRGRILALVLTAVVLLVAAGLGLLGLRVLDRLETMETQVSHLAEQAAAASSSSDRALEEARRAESAARAAAEGRELAEAERARAHELAESARGEAEAAHGEARVAREDADRARAEAERIRQEAEAELSRLEDALGKIAETRRTALGFVLNLGEDSIKFDFDKAELRPANRELLSRIAGILLTSSDFTVSVNGHTDDVGTAEYNQKLSERRAQAVYDYLLEAGVPVEILSVKGWGKTDPLVEGTTAEARAKNRRVELGIVNARVQYRGAATEKN